MNVQCVLEDIVAGNADRMDEQLTRECRQREASPDLRAVDTEGSALRWRRLFPFREYLARVVIETQEQPDVARAVTRPIVHAGEPGSEVAVVSKKSEIRGEVEWVE